MEKEWKEIAQSFENKWNFPHVIGALDGKHIVIQAPHNAGSGYFNYKKTHSVVLLAICNVNYEFILVDIGDSGRKCDDSVHTNSHLGFCIENKKLSIPACDEIINGLGVKFPNVFLADDTFGLKPHRMKSYTGQKLTISQLIFNYRLSRARRVMENTFGIMASRFRIFRSLMTANVDKVVKVTKACVALYNFLMKTINSNSNGYCPANYVDNNVPSGERPFALQPLNQKGWS